MIIEKNINQKKDFGIVCLANNFKKTCYSYLLFRYKQFNKEIITVAVGYYLIYALSYCDISEILREYYILLK